LTLRRLEFFELLRTGWRLVCVNLDPPDTGARFGHRGQGRLLEFAAPWTVFTRLGIRSARRW